MNNTSTQRNGMTYSDAGKLGYEAAKEKIKQKRILQIQNYNDNPKKCLFCNNIIPYKKRINNFCSHSCAAKHNNPVRAKPKFCKMCCKQIKKSTYYCSNACQQNHYHEIIWEKIITSGSANGYGKKIIRNLLLKKYGIRCQICNLDTWNDQPIPVVVDHIDGHSDNNLLSNLRIICCNCDALLPTYKGKNYGNGPFKRRERYRSGKSY